MKTTIYFNTKSNSGSQIISEPYFINVDFGSERMKIYNEIGDEMMLNVWCKKVLSDTFKNYHCEIVKIEVK